MWIALLSSLGAMDAQADGRAWRPALHWSRAENAAECVDPRTLAELVETYTGPVLATPSSADASIEGTIERVGSETFRVHVSVTIMRGRPSGQRVLSLPAADCRKLDGAIAFVIASTLDPDLGAQSLPAELSWLQSETPAGEELREELASTPGEDPPRANPQPSAAAAERASEQAVEEPEAESSSPSHPWEIGLAVVAGKGRVPITALGGLLSVARAFGQSFAVSLQLRGNAGIGSFDIEHDRSVGVSAFDGALLACGRLGDAHALGAQGCLGPVVGFLSAVGSGFDASHTVVQPLFAMHLKLETRYEIASGWLLTAAGLLDVGYRRPLVQYTDLDAWRLVFRSDVYALQGAFGLVSVF